MKVLKPTDENIYGLFVPDAFRDLLGTVLRDETAIDPEIVSKMETLLELDDYLNDVFEIVDIPDEATDVMLLEQELGNVDLYYVIDGKIKVYKNCKAAHHQKKDRV